MRLFLSGNTSSSNHLLLSQVCPCRRHAQVLESRIHQDRLNHQKKVSRTLSMGTEPMAQDRVHRLKSLQRLLLKSPRLESHYKIVRPLQKQHPPKPARIHTPRLRRRKPSPLVSKSRRRRKKMVTNRRSQIHPNVLRASALSLTLTVARLPVR